MNGITTGSSYKNNRTLATAAAATAAAAAAATKRRTSSPARSKPSPAATATATAGAIVNARSRGGGQRPKLRPPPGDPKQRATALAATCCEACCRPSQPPANTRDRPSPIPSRGLDMAESRAATETTRSPELQTAMLANSFSFTREHRFERVDVPRGSTKDAEHAP